MVLFKIFTFIHLNVDYHHQEHFFGREWHDSQFQNVRGGVKVLKFWIVCPLKTFIFGRSKHPKKSSKHLLRLASDSQKKNCRLMLPNFFSQEDSRFPSRSHKCVWVMRMTIPVPFLWLLMGTHSAGIPIPIPSKFLGEKKIPGVPRKLIHCTNISISTENHISKFILQAVLSAPFFVWGFWE